MVMMARLLLLLLLLLRVQAPAGFNGVAACFQSVSRTSHGHADALVVQAAYGEKTAENTEFLWPWSVMVHSPVSVRQILAVLSLDAVRTSPLSVLNTAECTRCKTVLDTMASWCTRRCLCARP